MDYRRLGRSGLKVSEICLGTMTFGHGTDTNEAERITHDALDAGVNQTLQVSFDQGLSVHAQQRLRRRIG